MLFAGLSLTRTSNARLHAYYVVQNVSIGNVTPKILFFLDTSSTMTVRAQSLNEACEWSECEDGNGSSQSRVAAARKAIKKIVEDYSGQASFAIASFRRRDSPDGSTGRPIPDFCASGDRFQWAQYYHDGEAMDIYDPATGTIVGGASSAIVDLLTTVSLAGEWDIADWTGFLTGLPGREYMAIRPIPGVPMDPTYGQWMLCGDNLPYPYIRWDEINTALGVAKLSNNRDLTVDPLGPAPMLSSTELLEPGNAARKVQWFNRFLGPHVNLQNTAGTQDFEDLCLSAGDFGVFKKAGDAKKCAEGTKPLDVDIQNNVAGQDFYYWPYVDRFPGYGGFTRLTEVDSSAVSTPDKNDWAAVLTNLCSEAPAPFWCPLTGSANAKIDAGVVLKATAKHDDWDTPERLGVMADASQNNSVKRTIFGLFYQPEVAAGLAGNYPDEEWFPADEADALKTVLGVVSPMAEGGLDATGPTDWEAVIGQSNSNVQCNSSSTFTSAGTVSTYLGFQRCDGTTADRCAPLTAIIITDGEADEDSAARMKQVHTSFGNLRKGRKTNTYVVGFAADGKENVWGRSTVNDFACAATGGGMDDPDDPCNSTADNNNFDTCKDPSDPNNECAFMAANPEELALALTDIITAALGTNVPAGGGSAVNTFGTTGGASNGITQTNVSARTEWPSWRGHVERDLCDDPTAEACQNTDAPVLGEDFGPCDPSRVWDAGTCLQSMNWWERRVYITDANNNVKAIWAGGETGDATTDFKTVLNASGAPGTPFSDDEVKNIAMFIMGSGWKDDWKLPGLAASSPTVVKRVPKPDPKYAPSVGISDPHCAGRLLASPEEVDADLVQFAEDAWDPANKITGGFGSHFEYQEAVLIGDDLGLLHAFQFDSGNELWALMPRFAIKAAVAEYAYGGEVMGQPNAVSDHIYGVSASANHGWVWDDTAGKWRHLAVSGRGEGGTQLMALDVSHMSPASADGPVEVLWTSKDPGLATGSGGTTTGYDDYLGETWARPALTYQLPPDPGGGLPGDALGGKPEGFLLIGSGYPSPGAATTQGRTMLWANALTGEILDTAELPIPTTPIYEGNFGAVVDPAVGTHCISRFWGESQEAYIADPAGRLYRWDFGRDTSHESDSGGVWSGTANPVATFRACDDVNDTCTPSTSSPADPFLYSPAIVSLNRIDEIPGNSGDGIDANDKDQFLVAMVSGSPYDDSIDGRDDASTFHPSLYIMVDDHYNNSKSDGFTVQEATKVAAGSDPNFMREVLTDIERTRQFLPYPDFDPASDTCPNSASPSADGLWCEETRLFSKRARPIRAPRISVSGLNKLTGCSDPLDPATCTGPSTVEAGIEIYTIEFTVYEPGINTCQDGWYDADEDVWYYDQGASYVISYQLSARDEDGFNLQTGAGLGWAGAPDGLVVPNVAQIVSGDCEDGNCGPQPGVPSNLPCDPNEYSPPADITYTIPLTTSEIEGFSRVESDGIDAPPVTAP